LLVLVVAIAAAGAGTLLTAWTVLDREVARGYAATRPAAATLWVDGVDDAALAAVAAVPGVAAVDARRIVNARVAVGPIAWRDLQLVVPRSFGDLVVARFVPERGTWPPATDEILVERDALSVARKDVGDTVRVRVGGVERNMRIAGTVHDPGQAQARMENLVYAYATRETLATLDQGAHLDRVLVALTDPDAGAERGRDVIARVEARLAELGYAVRRSELGQGHPHASLMQMLLRVQAAFGALLLLLGGALVAQLYTIDMASRVREVGVMSALGARRGQIASRHLAQAAMVGAIAFALAAPACSLGAQPLARFIAAYLNFDVVDSRVPIWVFVAQFAAAVVMPVLAAAWPIWRGSRVSVREAIADHGLGSRTFGRARLDRLLARLSARAGGRLSRPLLLSLRSGLRQRPRLVWTLTPLTLGGISFLAAFDLRAAFVHTLDGLFATRKYDLSLSLGSLQPLAAIERAALATPGVQAVEGWITTQAAVVASRSAQAPARTSPSFLGHGKGPSVGHGAGAAEDDRERFTVLAVPATSCMHAPVLVAGRLLLPQDEDALVVNETFARGHPGLRVGGTLTLQMGPQEKAWTIVGVVREPFATPAGYVPLPYFERAGHVGVANTVRLRLADTDPDAVELLAGDLEQNLEREGVRPRSRQSTGGSRFAFDQHFVMFYDALLVIAALVFAVGGAGLASALVLGLHERRRELGLLRALGASPRLLALLVVVEGCSIAAAGWLLATLVAAPLVRTASDALLARLANTSLSLTSEPGARLLLLALALTVAVVASALPAWRASRVTVREVLTRV